MNIDAPADEEGFDPEELEEEDDGTDSLSTVSLPITPKPTQLASPALARSRTRMARSEPVGEPAPRDLWAARVGSAVLASASRTRLEPRAAHALAVQLRPRTGRVGADRVAHRFLALARERLREWVATCGTRLDRDRPTRQTTWPGEVAQAPIEDEVIPDRDADFITFVSADAARRAQIEEETTAAAVAAAKGSEVSMIPV